jgi:PAS domain S-box-containing protein
LKARALDRQNLYESLLANTSNAIISNTLQGIVTSWNPAAEEIFGYIAEEMIGRPLAMIIPAGRRDGEAEILEKIRRGERIKIMTRSDNERMWNYFRSQ